MRSLRLIGTIEPGNPRHFATPCEEIAARQLLASFLRTGYVRYGENGADLAKILTRLGSAVSEEDLAASAFLIMHLGEATVRLAISVDRAEGERLVAVYKHMAEMELRRIVGGNAIIAPNRDN